jgi:hypothetical protein
VGRLGEVDDACPLVIPLWGEAGIELLDLLLGEDVGVELIDAVTAFFSFGFGGVGLDLSVELSFFFKRGSHANQKSENYKG